MKRINHSKYLCSTSIRVRQRNFSHLSHLKVLQQAQLVRGETQHSGKQSSTSAACDRSCIWRLPGLTLTEIQHIYRLNSMMLLVLQYDDWVPHWSADRWTARGTFLFLEGENFYCDIIPRTCSTLEHRGNAHLFSERRFCSTRIS